MRGFGSVHGAAYPRVVGAILALLAASGCVEDQQTPLSMVDAAPPAPDMAPPDRDPIPDLAPPPDMAPPTSCGNEDDLAPNQRPADATPIEVGFGRMDLFVCPETSDHFALTLSAGRSVTIDLMADPPQTDLDLALLDGEGEVIAQSAGEEGTERIEYVAEADGPVIVRVTGYRDQAAFYALGVSGSCRLDAQCGADQVCDRYARRCVALAGGCGDDPQEPNDRDDAATMLPLPIAVEGAICGADRDWFALDAVEGQAFEVLAGADPGADIDLILIDAAGEVVASALNDANTNPERLIVSGLPAGAYRLGVVLFVPDDAPDGEVDYALEVIGRADAACAIDRDCLGDGLPRCEDGLCRPAEPGAALGGRCGSDADCDDDAELCYTGGAGGHDNICTRTCQGDFDCAGLGAGAFCAAISQNTAICFGGCESDDDCGVFYACRAGSCEVRGECRADVDCAEGERCTPARTGDRYCAVPLPPPACGADDLGPNDRPDEASPLAFDAPFEGALCNRDDDWFALDVPAEAGGSTLTVSASFRAGVDIDVYVFDARGNPVGSALSPDMTTETARVSHIAPGRYTVRVDQFDGDRLADTAYTVEARLMPGEPCTVDGGECARTEPLRSVCDEASGGCVALEGEGAVPLGGRCDSDDDCVPEAALCWTFEGGERFNICTGGCRADADCAPVPDTVCTPVNQRFALCLPPRE